ncbi:MAG: methylenetetrahydrofolate reductase [NAD(P)H] [Acidimicrobiia bacterium]|nr:methylenetetrahydrofolate reductase [NAD(P)H] [Acidimicrobiia bacterium]
MTKISDILANGERTISFEFGPPRTDEAMLVLEQTLVDLEPLSPSYVSVTYGAGGSTRERTHEIVTRIDRETSMTAMAHITCAAHSRSELVDIIERYQEAGIENLLALRGDPPKDLDLPPGDLDYAIDLVRLIREIGDFCVGVAAHPEPHPQSPDLESDRRHTAEKLAEADFAITQFFFDAAHYFNLISSLRALGVDKPVIPGIMPVLSIAGTKRMAEMQGSEFPEWFMAKFHAVQDDPDAVRKIGIDEATKLCRELLDGGAPGLHFYTLNRSNATREIHTNLGL